MIDDLIEEFNDEDYERILMMFGDFETFFKVLHRRNRLDEVVGDYYYGNVWENDYLLFLKTIDNEKFLKEVGNLRDVKIVNGKPYFIGDDLSDLSDLFCDDRNGSVSIVKSIFSNDFWEHYDDTTDDVFRDVIQELNPNNLDRLKKVIIQYLKNEKIEPSTDLLEEISSEQNHPDYVEINENVINNIISDEDSMNYLLDENLEELKDDLYNIHRNAYNSALESETYNEIWNELSYFFVGTPKWESIKYEGRKNPVEFFMIEIRDFDFFITSYLKENRRYQQDALSSQDNILQIWKENYECLRLRTPYYPNYSDLKNNLNEFFDI